MSLGEPTLLAGDHPIHRILAEASANQTAFSRRKFDLRSFRPGLILAGAFVIFLVVAALQPAWLVSGDPLEAHAREAFRAPTGIHLLGTDENGRDVLTRIIYGVRPSLIMGVAATAIGVTLGTGLGLTAGLSHRLIDGAVMGGINIMSAFPHLLVALVIITFFGQGSINVLVAVGLASVPRYARLVRAQTFVVRDAPYIEAAKTLGLPWITLIHRHVLPNAIKPILILGAISVGEKIGFGASLSFLGLGSPPPSPEWGSMLSAGRNFLANAWWLTAVPGLAITLTVISITALGRELFRRNEGKIA